MLTKLKFYLRYILFWIIVLQFFKTTFIIYHAGKLKNISFLDIVGIYTHGILLDISLIGYILAVPTLVLIVFSLFKFEHLKKIFDIYTLVILFIICLLEIIDHELYNYWRYRLDDSFLEFISTPGEMLASLNFFHYVVLTVLLAGLYFLFYKFLYQKYIIKGFTQNPSTDIVSSVTFVFFLSLLFIPIRGGLQTAPINTGTVYFSKNIVINHCAVNPVWNLIYTLTEGEKLNFSRKYFDENKKNSELAKLKSEDGVTKKILKTEDPNIILILIESFGGNVLEITGGRNDVAPQFTRLIHEGVFFNNFFANGTSSSKGIASVISGYPSASAASVLSYENKTQNLPGISKSLKSKGYTSRFYYGGDIDFAHINSYLLNMEFDEIISHSSFPKDQYMSKWGVPDHIVFKRLLEETNKTKDKFFNMYFTLSSHEPFEVPMETVIEGNDKKSKYYNSIYYTDKSIGEFIESAKQQPWWNNTLIIMVADHGSRIEDITNHDITRFRIPMLWIGGALNVQDTIISKYCSQIDIPKTLLNQISVPSDDYIFSKDILNSGSKSFASYNCQNGMGFVSDSIYMVYNYLNNELVEKKGYDPKFNENIIKAITQEYLEDFADR